MNGIVTELWRVLQASRHLRMRPADSRSPELSETASVYGDLLRALDNHPKTETLRVVVDTVAGTSAGGLNAVALSKAIVEGGDFSVLNKVWIELADIHQLKAEVAGAPWPVRAFTWLGYQYLSVTGVKLPKVLNFRRAIWPWLRDVIYQLLRRKRPIPPFDSRDFTLMIAAAYASMEATGDRVALLPSRSQFNLFVTQTDLFGWPQHLKLDEDLHSEPQVERAHAQVMTLHSAACPGTTTRPVLSDAPILVFASRTTAGFPLVFQPINFKQIAAYLKECGFESPADAQADDVNTLLPDYQAAGLNADSAWMVDGGVLDNKPFANVIKAIATNPADRQVYRRLLYVEPDPEAMLAKPPVGAPGMWHGVRQVWQLLRHEPIAADLRMVEQYNTKVAKILAARDANYPLAMAAARQSNAWPDFKKTPPTIDQLMSWRAASNMAANLQAPGYAGYLTLKLQAAANIFVHIICRSLQLPENCQHAQLVRNIVEAWIERRQSARQTSSLSETTASADDIKMLRAFDIPFRLRRLFALVDTANKIYDTEVKHRSRIDAFKRQLAVLISELESLKLNNREITDDIHKVFGGAHPESVSYIYAAFRKDKAGFLNRHDHIIGCVYNDLSSIFTSKSENINHRLMGAISAVNMADVTTAFVTFPFLDLVTFPLMELAGIDNLIPVKTMRVSPCDATSLSTDASRLKCRQLDGFYGFFSRSAREHDLLWGRLDGAERLITLIINAAATPAMVSTELEALQKDFTRRAHVAILQEEKARPGTLIGDDISALEKILQRR